MNKNLTKMGQNEPKISQTLNKKMIKNGPKMIPKGQIQTENSSKRTKLACFDQQRRYQRAFYTKRVRLTSFQSKRP